MNEKYTAQAATTEAAIDKALKALGIERTEATIEIKQEGKKGFLGIGQKDATVVVKKKQTTNVVEELLSKEVMLGEERGSTIKPSEDEKEQTVVESVEEKVSQPETIETVEKNEIPEEKQMTEEVKETPSTERIETVINEQDEEAISKVADYLKTIALKMGVDDVSIDVKRDHNRVKFSIETEDAGLIIGRHGKVLNSLQTLAQIQLHQEADNKLYAKVDAENYRDRRKQTVEQLATRTAEKVKRTNRPVILEPMPAHERKQIHRYLNQFTGVQTHSEGKDPHRYLVVEPSKEEEFTL